ncbi:MAG: hypothetical protein SGI72_04850 [Planctomycetota bacterium]|nr:hypothetical protein [Planctomycetota bacterium]
MPRVTAEKHIASLEAQIATLKSKIAAAKVQKDPALRTISKAIRFVDQAASATRDASMRESLEEARSTLSACLQLKGLTLVGKSSAPRRVRGGGDPVDRDALLSYVRSNPGSRGENIAQALGTDVDTMRPVMKALIADGKVRTMGQRRGMTYLPA